MKNLKVNLAIIIIIVIFGLLEVWPPEQKLKPGIDLAGGTSLLYQIDTTGLTDRQQSSIAQDMIRVLQQRIDPGAKRNLVWRPHGKDRIEIQMPLASEETQQKRRAYQEALDALEDTNINLRAVRQALVVPAGMALETYKQQRQKTFERLAEGSSKKKELLMNLARAADTYRLGQERLARAIHTEREVRQSLQATQVNVDAAERLARQWDSLDDPNRFARVEQLTGRSDPNAAGILSDYIDARSTLSEMRQQVVGEMGLKAQYEQAEEALEENNIDIDRVKKVLQAKPGVRPGALEELKLDYPERSSQIDQLVGVYDQYATVAGRLDDPEDLKRLLKGSGVLEFRILPTMDEDVLSETQIAEYRRVLEEKGPKAASDDQYKWVKLRDPEEFNDPQGGAIRGEFAGTPYVLASNRDNECMLHERQEDTWRLTNSRVGNDQFNKWAVDFELNEIGANRFLELTKGNLQRPLAILLDGEIVSAPNINSPIHDRGQITGEFSQREVMDLVDKLNAGSLPARLGDEPISVNTIGPLIGKNNLMAGLKAGIWSLAIVAGFMLVYYRVAGGLTDLALLMNILIIISVMAFSRGTFTLPGIAGLILTIGMAVDANVLVNERIREEQERGSSFRMAVKNGYERAFRTILDANATTFITALILWMLASEEVKGFALTLMIGLVANMFTALFVTRTIFSLLIERRVLKDKLTMMRLFGTAAIKWMDKRPVFYAVSAILVVGGWALFLAQAKDKFSIEFVGGTSVHVLLNEQGQDMTREDVQAAIKQVGQEMDNEDIAAAQVQRIITPDNSKMFEILTLETNRLEVKLMPGDGASLTAEQATEAIREQARFFGDDRMEEVTVTAGSEPGQLQFITRQSNHNRVRQVLEKALPEVTYTVETQDTVNSAVRTALAGKLDVQNDLEPADVDARPITDAVIAEKPYLTDYKGHLLVTADFTNGRDTLERLDQRFGQLQFKPEFEVYGDPETTLFSPDNRVVDMDQPLEAVEVVVQSDELLYDGEVDSLWSEFQGKQAEMVTRALELETSLPRVTQIDPSVGQKSLNQAAIAMVLALIVIVVYVWIRFGNVRFGTAAIVALVHDVSVTLGMVALTGWLADTAIGRMLLINDFKIDLPMIAAFLTLIGYSLNDTIVVFDRVRENRGKMATFSPTLINNSINQMLSRTVLTSVTTLMVLLVMYIGGGAALRGFNFVMIIGITVGTYSSIAVASPLLLVGQDKDGNSKKSS